MKAEVEAAVPDVRWGRWLVRHSRSQQLIHIDILHLPRGNQRGSRQVMGTTNTNVPSAFTPHEPRL